VYVPSLGVFTFKIQFISIRVPCNILKCTFLCLRLAFNLFMLNVGQCTLYDVNNESQLKSLPVTCRQRLNFLYFSQYTQTLESSAEGLGVHS
jgi:hypothetical protein